MQTHDSEAARPSRARAILVPLVKAGVSIALLALLFSKVDVARLWTVARTASVPWLLAALGLYLGMILLSAWRWGLLLEAQGIPFTFRRLTSSFLVASFFNNFLPSNIGGDVIRIGDTAPAAGSKTLATTVVLIDRGLGLLGLALVAALGASFGLGSARIGPFGPAMLWAGFGAAAGVATPALAKFRESPGALASCFVGAVGVQAILVAFYLAIAHSLRIPITFAQLAVIVPISFIVQMVPLSMNGFGVREATFGFYFTRLGLPLESALLLSFIGAALILLFSLSGGVAYLGRLRRREHPGVLRSTPRSA